MPADFPVNSTNQIIQAAQGCGGVPTLTDADRQIQALLKEFNLGVQGSFAAGGVEGMRRLTTPEGYQVMQKKYATWMSRQVTELNLVSCEFLAFNLTGDGKARAWTFEKWIFVYADGKTLPTAGSVDGYDLQQIDGEWRVVSARTYAAEAE